MLKRKTAALRIRKSIHMCALRWLSTLGGELEGVVGGRWEAVSGAVEIAHPARQQL